MQWNWQHKEWPKFSYDERQLREFEAQFLQQSGLFLGTWKHINETDQIELRVEIISNEALKTSEIEGEYLNRESLQSSIRRNFGLATDNRKVSTAEQGISEMMVDLYKNFTHPLNDQTLFDWHTMLTKGRRDLHDIGKYRTHSSPMQVVSGPIHNPKVHFEAPPSSTMVAEMRMYIDWFNQTAPQTELAMPALTRAGLAHLYFVTIHPFEDGNGRIGRALSEKVLSQNLGNPTLIALSHVIEKNKKRYYDQLEKINKTLEITPWLLYFCETILAAQHYSQQLVDFLISKAKLFDRFRDQINERQKKVIERLFRAGPEGFLGGLSADNYISIAHTSRATATRDLQDLVAKKILKKSGELKSTRYYLNLENVKESI